MLTWEGQPIQGVDSIVEKITASYHVDKKVAFDWRIPMREVPAFHYCAA